MFLTGSKSGVLLVMGAEDVLPWFHGGMHIMARGGALADS